MGVNWNKEPDGTKVANLGTLTSVEIEMTFEQRKARGMLGSLRDSVAPADPDLVAGIGAGTMLVDLIDPKDNPTGKNINGAVQCVSGDQKGSGVEVVRVDITKMHEEDGDIDAIVLGGFCPGRQGFGRIAGVVCRLYNTSPGQVDDDGKPVDRKHLANVRFDISSTDSAVLAASLHQQGDGAWQIRNSPRYGRAETVAQVGNLFRTALR